MIDCGAHGADIACEKLDYLAWQKNFPRSVRDRAPGLLMDTIRRKAESAGGDRLYEYATRTTALSQTCLCGDAEKSRSPNGSTVADAGSASIGMCSRPTSDCTSEPPRMAPIGWICRQPTRAGCIVTTSTGAEIQPLQYRNDEAADTRPRGGQWRASTPGAKPKPRSDRADWHQHPLANNPRRHPYEQRDSRPGRWNPRALMPRRTSRNV
ncbi:MAG: hypothetical protein QOH27_5027 [Mycobacterium sp.]|jgi:hypothetical protein|nr:hypothetical protein [Mycobacterium sp.]